MDELRERINEVQGIIDQTSQYCNHEWATERINCITCKANDRRRQEIVEMEKIENEPNLDWEEINVAVW